MSCSTAMGSWWTASRCRSRWTVRCSRNWVGSCPWTRSSTGSSGAPMSTSFRRSPTTSGTRLRGLGRGEHTPLPGRLRPRAPTGARHRRGTGPDHPALVCRVERHPRQDDLHPWIDGAAGPLRRSPAQRHRSQPREARTRPVPARSQGDGLGSVFLRGRGGQPLRCGRRPGRWSSQLRRSRLGSVRWHRAQDLVRGVHDGPAEREVGSHVMRARCQRVVRGKSAPTAATAPGGCVGSDRPPS